MIITGASEKQITWAQEIVKNWRSGLTTELDIVNKRNASGDQLEWFAENLEKAVAKFDEAIEKISVKQVIELHTAKRSPVGKMINQSRIKPGAL